MAPMMYCISCLLLSGDVELNPGPPKVDPSKKLGNSSKSIDSSSNSSERSTRSTMTTQLSATAASSTENADIVTMLTEVLEQQKLMAEDLAKIKSFQSSVNSRFDALETRVAVLESPTTAQRVDDNVADLLRSEVKTLTGTVAQLVAKNDDLDNRSRRNNIIIHGLDEKPDENEKTLLDGVGQIFSCILQITPPHTERCHRIGGKRRERPRPVILKLLDFREKSAVMKNVSKLKGSQYYITEDFSASVRAAWKKIWDASTPFRRQGSVVKLRYDYVFIDKVRYNWDGVSNALIRDPKSLNSRTYRSTPPDSSPAAEPSELLRSTSPN